MDGQNGFRNKSRMTHYKNRNGNDTKIQKEYGIFNNRALAYVLCSNVMGNLVEILQLDEAQSPIIGIVTAISPAGDFILETIPKSVVNGKNGTSSHSKKFIRGVDIKMMHIRDVQPNDCLKSTVLTDQEIGKLRHGERSSNLPLQPFFQSTDGILEDDLSNAKTGDHWFSPKEMFNVNEQVFNVATSYEQNLRNYTIELDNSAPNFAEREARAEKLAKEIELDQDHQKAAQLENEESEEQTYSAVTRSDIETKTNNLSLKDCISVPKVLSKSDTTKLQCGVPNHSKTDTISVIDNEESDVGDTNVKDPVALNPDAAVFCPQPSQPSPGPNSTIAPVIRPMGPPRHYGPSGKHPQQSPVPLLQATQMKSYPMYSMSQFALGGHRQVMIPPNPNFVPGQPLSFTPPVTSYMSHLMYSQPSHAQFIGQPINQGMFSGQTVILPHPPVSSPYTLIAPPGTPFAPSHYHPAVSPYTFLPSHGVPYPPMAYPPTPNGQHPPANM